MSLIARIKAKSRDSELHWLVNEMVTPELPQLIEALQICSNLLLYNSPQHPDKTKHIQRGPGITLPVSSGKSEELKGIVVRDGAYITKMSVVLKERHFNRILHKLNLVKPFLLPQILTAKRSIDNAIDLLQQACSVFDDMSAGSSTNEKPVPQCDFEAHDVLVSVFTTLLTELQTAKNSLQLPTDPELVFPLHVTPASFFEPELSSNIALDLYISSAEVCVDLKDLQRVSERPWGDVNAVTGKSYVDEIRDKMSSGKLDKIDQAGAPAESSERGVLQNVFSHLSLKPKHDPQDYITRCVTYNGAVVMINKKIEVSSADPVLVSAFTKLDSVEYLVSSFLQNISTLLERGV